MKSTQWCRGALEIQIIQIYSKCQPSHSVAPRRKPSARLGGEVSLFSRGEKNLKFFQVGSSAQLGDTTMQSKVSEEVDMGTALLRTWKSEASKPARRVLSEKVKVFRCINVSDLEKRVNGRAGAPGLWVEFHSVGEGRDWKQNAMHMKKNVKFRMRKTT